MAGVSFASVVEPAPAGLVGGIADHLHCRPVRPEPVGHAFRKVGGKAGEVRFGLVEIALNQVDILTVSVLVGNKRNVSLDDPVCLCGSQ